MSQPTKETLDLLAELDAEFGKPARDRKSGGRSKSPIDLASAKAQLERTRYTSFSDWEQHKSMVEANELSKSMDRRPSWLPEAKITYCVRQHCETCGNNVDFIGGEYIRFRSKRERATITRRAEVCTDLWHYGFNGSPLPDLVDELYQVVSRCPGCIKVEQRATELWEAVERRAEQKEQLEIEL